MRGIRTMARILRMGIRLSQEEHWQIQEAVRRLEFKGPSALVRQAIHNELAGRSAAATNSEDRVAATLERVLRDVTRVARGQQALFAVCSGPAGGRDATVGGARQGPVYPLRESGWAGDGG
jgi:hypothetical protein